MTEKTHYTLLGVSENASTEDIKKAYKERAKDYHPDQNGSTELMILLNLAREILLNPEKRKLYDQTLKQSKIHYRTVTVPLKHLYYPETWQGGGRKSLKPCLCVGNDSLCPECNGDGLIRYKIGCFTTQQGCKHCDGKGHLKKETCTICQGTEKVEHYSETLWIPYNVSHGSLIKSFLGETVQVSIETELPYVYSFEEKRLTYLYTSTEKKDSFQITLPTGKKIDVCHSTEKPITLKLSGKGLPESETTSHPLYIIVSGLPNS